MIGLAPFGVTQKKDPSGPPFAANSADNGDSVDLTSGKIVLGNDVGDPLMPAALLKDREIVTFSAFAIELVDFFMRSLRLRLTEQRILLEEIASASNFTVTAFGGTPNMQLTGSIDAVAALNNPTGGFGWQTNGINPYWEAQNPSGSFRGMMNLAVLVIKSANGGGNGLELDPVANDVKSTGTLSSADPGSGSGVWRLGKFTAGAVAPDAANYVEVMIDGVVRKLIVAV